MKKKSIYLPPDTFVVRYAPLIADNTYGNDEGYIGFGSREIDAGMGQAKDWLPDDEDVEEDFWSNKY